MQPFDLRDSLERFALALIGQPEVPDNEQTIRVLLGDALARELPDSRVRYEERAGRKKIDLWVAPHSIAVEVKFHRGTPSGWNRPFTQVFGSILNDFSKLAAVKATERLVVLVSDKAGFTHVSNVNLLPTIEGISREISPPKVDQLPSTAAKTALASGPWPHLRAECVWRKDTRAWHFVTWRIVPENTYESDL